MLILRDFVCERIQVAEKVSEGPVFVAKPFLAVWFFKRLAKAHSQEWLCYVPFSAACNSQLGQTKDFPQEPVLGEALTPSGFATQSC